MRREDAVLAVIREAVEGRRELIPNWQLLSHATDALNSGGAEGLKRYDERGLDLAHPRVQRVKQTLGSHGRKTLESEYERFQAIYRSGSA